MNIEEIKSNLKEKDFLKEDELINKIKELTLKNNFIKDNLNYIINHIHKSKKKNKYYLNYKKETKIKKKISKLINSSIYIDNIKDEIKEDDKEIINEELKDNDNDKEDSDDFESFFENLTNTKYKKIKSNYKFPNNTSWTPILNKDVELGPYGTQWLHDKQEHDELDNVLADRGKIYDKLRSVILPEQRSKEWFDMRNGAITASDIGTVLGDNKYEKQYEFIVKKVYGRTFTSNEHCYHGKMLEEPATMAYQYRMNVKVEEFGLMMHPKYRFLGASPDGIVNKYKLDGLHKTKYVGRMLEIKCPKVRKIKMEGPIKAHICPIYYWDQVQLQLECCNLEECDFWQCKITLYKNREDFIDDTDEKEPFRAKSSGHEKGCLLQLMPLKRTDDIIKGKYLQAVYEDAKFIYPKNIEMTPYDCDQWIAEKVGDIDRAMKEANIYGYYFDKVIYWKIEHTKNVTIKRDREWFKESLKTFRHIWSKVEFLRKNKNMKLLFKRYLDSLKIKRNNKIMEVINKLSDINVNQTYISNLMSETEEREEKKKEKNDMDDYMFI